MDFPKNRFIFSTFFFRHHFRHHKKGAYLYPRKALEQQIAHFLLLVFWVIIGQNQESSKRSAYRNAATVGKFWPILPEVVFHQGVAGCRTPSGHLYCTASRPSGNPAQICKEKEGAQTRLLLFDPQDLGTWTPGPRKLQTPHMSGATGGLGVGPHHLSVTIMVSGAGSRKIPQPSHPHNSNPTYKF